MDVHWQSQLFTAEHLMVIISHCPAETSGPRGSVVMRNSWSCDSCDTSLLCHLGVEQPLVSSSSQAQAVPLLLQPVPCHQHCGTTTTDSFPAKPKANSFVIKDEPNLSFLIALKAKDQRKTCQWLCWCLVVHVFHLIVLVPHPETFSTGGFKLAINSFSGGVS